MIRILQLMTIKVFLAHNISWQNRYLLLIRTTHIHQDDRI